MIKENKSNASCKDAVTPKTFVKATKSIMDFPAYDWNIQRSTIVAFSSWRQTFRNPDQWESD